VAIVTLVLMTGGYFASQLRPYMQVNPTEYAQRVDTPGVSHLALCFFLPIVILGFIPDQSAFG